MKRMICLILALLLCGVLAVPALAAPSAPSITMQPQSPCYTQYAVATYTVKAEGTNLSATWYMNWQGSTYVISDLGGAQQPWEGYAGEGYGPRRIGSDMFMYVFEGIGAELDGAYIWCVIEDGHYDVTTQKARINVGYDKAPPEIVSVTPGLTVEQGASAEIRCVARSNGNGQLSFLWYETDSGRLEDIRAVNRGEETTDYMFCDTSTVGTRYYICKVENDNGGIVYSSVVPVTVVAKQAVDVKIETANLPNATAGKSYSTQLKCSDPKAEFALYYNPGKANDFDKTGLTLQKDGKITGTPKAAGSYTFCVSAAGAGGEDYAVYTLTVAAKPVEESSKPTEESSKPAVPEESSNTAAQEKDPTVSGNLKEENSQMEAEILTDDPPEGFPWWSLALVGLVAAGGGVGVAVLLTKKK